MRAYILGNYKSYNDNISFVLYKSLNIEYDGSITMNQ